jgi:hypothetical protein
MSEQVQSQTAQLNIQVPSVPMADTAAFAKIWTNRGVVIPLQDTHLQFANDYANLVLRNFIVQATMANMQRAKQLESQKPKLIVEGIV